ncbi:MAG: hypothetical protein A2204_04805 [Elusimicrobia bacterium RIFOXYA1_FULL_47_7]|nr:MAG: hypothetical protein A2278_01070 [Elusimicrobia bacterium RIFOXYA12_FULL_49_49]OGS08175.1 MAG: hypothetical protein A2204_04805 [Elusimicrobia bacterium RIFOXYA1_FULL_47_7]OGS15788.1 MAG: hypothetical protein A2251_03970 [Elusimicrobia bacterium RIFOXYA2_FULL_47_53]
MERAAAFFAEQALQLQRLLFWIPDRTFRSRQQVYGGVLAKQKFLSHHDYPTQRRNSVCARP